MRNITWEVVSELSKKSVSLRKPPETIYDAEFRALSNGAKMKLIALLEKSLEQENWSENSKTTKFWFGKMEKWHRITLEYSREPKIAGDHLLSIPDVFWYLVLLCYWYLSKISSMLAIWWNTLVMMVYIGSIARPTPPLDQKSFRVHSPKFSRSCDDYKSLCIRLLIFSNPPAPRIQIFISLFWT